MIHTFSLRQMMYAFYVSIFHTRDIIIKVYYKIDFFDDLSFEFEMAVLHTSFSSKWKTLSESEIRL